VIVTGAIAGTYALAIPGSGVCLGELVFAEVPRLSRAEVVHNISLQLTPKVCLWFGGRPFARVRFALVIRRRN
jgi:hypothetical protein